MSTLQVMLGEAQGELKTPDGRAFKLFPLKLSDLAKLQSKLGPTAKWDSPETREKLQDIEVLCFILWLAIRRDPAAKELTPESVADLFELTDTPQLRIALEHIMAISGLAPKATAVNGAAAASTGPGSGST